MDFSLALKSRPLPSKEDLRFALAHFIKSKLTPLQLINVIEKATKITPYGVNFHPKGAIIVVSSQTHLEKLFQSVLKAGTPIFLTTYPECPIPVENRGKRWRISSVPFHLSETQ